jgi:hypothetical protein
VIMNIGGTSTLLGLIAMATDVEGLYASVKALVCVVRSNKSAANEMDRIKGYEVTCLHCVFIIIFYALSTKVSRELETNKNYYYYYYYFYPRVVKVPRGLKAKSLKTNVGLERLGIGVYCVNKAAFNGDAIKSLYCN